MWFKRHKHDWTPWKQEVEHSVSRGVGLYNFDYIYGVSERTYHWRRCNSCMKREVVEESYKNLDRSFWPKWVK